MNIEMLKNPIGTIKFKDGTVKKYTLNGGDNPGYEFFLIVGKFDPNTIESTDVQYFKYLSWTVH